MVETKELDGKYSFVKKYIYYFWDCTPRILILIIILFALFSYYFANFVWLLWNLCVQISGMLGRTSLSLISFIRKMITTTSMASKRIQVVHVNKGSDKIVIAQSTHNTVMGPITRSKAKSTYSPSTKHISDSTCLLKPVRTHDEHTSLWLLQGQKTIVLVVRENSL